MPQKKQQVIYLKKKYPLVCCQPIIDWQREDKFWNDKFNLVNHHLYKKKL